ncbi:MAG: hypothetical protein Q7S53_04900 [bacterium]|nr:hypothetical protein [bacterium]
MAGAEIYSSDLMFVILSEFPDQKFPYDEDLMHAAFRELADEYPQFFADRGITFSSGETTPRSPEITTALGLMERWGYLYVLNHGSNEAFVNHSTESKDHAEKVLSYFQPEEREKILFFSGRIQQKLITDNS